MILDILLAIILAYGFYVGYSKGIIKALFAILSVLLAVLASMKLSPLMITFLDGLLSWDPRWIIVLGFALTFIIVVIGIRYLGKMIEKTMVKLEINFVNKIIGGGITAGVFLVVFSTFVWFLDDVKLLSEQAKETSMTYNIIRPIPQTVAKIGKKVKPMFQEFWDKTGDAMDRIRIEAEERQKAEEPKSEIE
jgi:membrane protein required for colicin V production